MENNENDIGQRVAVIGEKLFHTFSLSDFHIEDAKIELYKSSEWSSVDSLMNYRLCIVSYDAFSSSTTSQQTFIKQMLEALEYGVNFCFVYYDEDVDLSNNVAKYNSLYHTQIGFQVIVDLKLGKVSKTDKPIHEGKVFKDELNPFLKKFGVTKVFFPTLSLEVEQLYAREKTNLGFSVQIKKGKIIYLPFLRDQIKPQTFKEGLQLLINCLLAYLVKSQTSLSEWAYNSPFFRNEIELFEQKHLLEEQLTEVKDSLDNFIEAKSLLFSYEHTLENSLPNFLSEKLGLKIERDEKYIEDFWLVDKDNNKLAIAEIKSKVKGFTKGLIGYLIAHRDFYEFDDDFPALLFVNCNLRVGSWKEKDKMLNKAEYDYAAYQNVLVIRVEDIVRLWEMRKLEKITSQEILELLVNSKGWLHVTDKLEIEVKPKPKKSK